MKPIKQISYRISKDIQRKLRLFGHMCRMEDNKKLKTLMFGIVDGTNKRQAM